MLQNDKQLTHLWLQGAYAGGTGMSSAGSVQPYVWKCSLWGRQFDISSLRPDFSETTMLPCFDAASGGSELHRDYSGQ